MARRAANKSATADEDLAPWPSPAARQTFLGDAAVIDDLYAAARSGRLTNGWLLTGGEGIGKATLAYRLSRLLLAGSNPQRTTDLIAAGAHPDLFVANRLRDEKTDRLATEITVETVRKLTQFLTRTPSLGDWRVAIVDAADDLNRNAANALLKALEEPPPRTTLLLLSAAPGRLIATIRSRCRKVALPPVPADEIAGFLVAEGAAAEEEARRLAKAARGRPGFALALAGGDGAVAASCAERFIPDALRGDAAYARQHLTGKAAEAAWPMFRRLFEDRLNDLVRETIVSPTPAPTASTGLAGAAPAALLGMRDEALDLLNRGDALNLDRGQLLDAVARLVKNTANDL